MDHVYLSEDFGGILNLPGKLNATLLDGECLDRRFRPPVFDPAEGEA